MGYTSPLEASLLPMHVPDHADELPDHLNPIPIPDTREEAACLCLLLALGLYPSCETPLGRKDSADQGDSPTNPI